MPVEFLSDEEVAAYGGFVGSPSPTELARWCLLDDADLRLVNRCRVDHLRLGFALQLVTVRALGCSWSTRWTCRQWSSTRSPASWGWPMRRA